MAIDGDTQRTEEILTALKSLCSLAPYNLGVYTLTGESSGCAALSTCASAIRDPLCHAVTRAFLEENPEERLKVKRAAVHRHSGGLLCFVIPLERVKSGAMLVGDGVRDTTIDLWQLAATSRAGGVDLFTLLNHTESLPMASVPQLEEIVDEIENLLASQHPSRMDAARPDETLRRLASTVWVLSRIDEAQTMVETMSLAGEMLCSFFDFPDIAAVLPDDEGGDYSVTGIWGVAPVMKGIPGTGFSEVFRQDRMKKCLPFDEELHALFPEVTAQTICMFPFYCAGQLYGLLAIFDRRLNAADLLHAELITSRLGSRLVQLKREAEQVKVSTLSTKLISLTNTLLVADSKEELYKITLEIAADLLSATQGSIMLIDKAGENLSIVFTKGMSLNIAKCLKIKVGTGIAGTVAKTGSAMVVNDVETDGRTAMMNRPRFKSKSLLCAPLKLKDKVIGVLNLSDKTNLSPFTEEDRQLVSSFADLASLIIERSMLMEESWKFEQLSVTDPLTGLYNRRFLQSRLEEEINRSTRQDLHLTVVFIDLDHFKAYNDICGHLMGDQALAKTASIIRRTLRDMDIVARYGGEEFCAVLPGTSKQEALVVAERIRAEVARETFQGEELMPLGTVTASLGIASFPEDGRSIDALLHASDVALYAAKAKGRNRVIAAPTAPLQPDAPVSATAVESEPPHPRQVKAPSVPENTPAHTTLYLTNS